MNALDLAGSFVVPNEQQARVEYPHVAYEHQLIAPGLMVPVWARVLVSECAAVGFGGFGRELLRYAAQLFPEPDGSIEGAYGRDADGEPIDYSSPERVAELARERRGLETIVACVAILQSDIRRDDKPMRIVSLLESMGVRFPTSESRGRQALARAAGLIR